MYSCVFCWVNKGCEQAVERRNDCSIVVLDVRIGGGGWACNCISYRLTKYRYLRL